MDTNLKLRNPILGSGADPWVIRKEGTYIYTHTTGDHIKLWKSDTLSGIGSGEGKVVWTPPGSGPQSRSIWAPEIHFIDGRYYIYFAADDGKNENHRMYVLESVGDDAFGPYVNRGQITDSTNKWAIDGTVLQIGRALYFIWSGWEDDENIRQNLYIAPMSNPWTISGKRIEISRPDRAWERIGEPNVNEGPVTLIRNNRIFLIYSASGSWTDDYCLGMLSAKLDDDPLRPESWKKHDRPVFARTDTVFGPGHNSFAKSPDGSEDWIVYHAAVSKGAGWNRNVRMQPFSWNEDGTPHFGAPVDTATALRLPSGE
ncbi:glycoside hydrolase family 43 protein [Paenibacillus harenae]|uniref:glycoside hydrolase family 43 protein n=1 Tax=Paenibacillus harenae TaxID=306543 RepID=UPI002791918D|nr:glycoside hydrolase family 43 protein [Paenibacillus harenae]MDQ0058756.1 GH43 family beta-xylosidase [Paenibacillus harenae]